MFFSNKFDSHTITHFIGCYAFTFTFYYIFKCPIWFAAGISLLLGVIWEILDDLNSKYQWHKSYLDPRGGDILDIVTDLIGIWLAVSLILLK